MTIVITITVNNISCIHILVDMLMFLMRMLRLQGRFYGRVCFVIMVRIIVKDEV